MEPMVCIMMATYNGEKYLGTQIQSIINQTYRHWKLVIQDDGSTDNTMEIVRQFNDDRIEYRNTPEKKHGAYYNFHSIANQEKMKEKSYDYYMFCDQDDIWDQDKIERMLKVIEKEDNSIPVFCYGDMRIINKEGETIVNSICNVQGLRYINDESLFFSHIIYGCNTIMNKKAFFSVPYIPLDKSGIDILSHDNLYAKFAGLRGKVLFYNETTMGYRRHDNNVTLKQEYGYKIGRIHRRIMKLNDLASDHARIYNQSLLALEVYGQRFGQTNKTMKIEKAIRNGGASALLFILFHRIRWGNYIKNISHAVIMILGLYKKYIIF